MKMSRPPKDPGLMKHPMDKMREPKPKNIKEIPGYLKRVISKFFYRLFYIFALVWEAKPSVLLLISFFSVILGVLPAISASIAKDILNRLAVDYALVKAGEGDPSAMLNEILMLLVWQFAIIFATSVVSSLKTYTTRIASELVAYRTNVKIMEKAKTVDVASFDRPDFYEKLENASREAGNRPMQVLSAACSCISAVISMVSFIVILAGIPGEVHIASLSVKTAGFAPVAVALVAIPSAVVSFVYRRKVFDYVRGRSKDRRQFNYYKGLMTNKDMVKEIRLFGLSDTFIERYKSIFGHYFNGVRRIYFSEGAWNLVMSILSSSVNCVLFLLIAKGVIAGDFEVGNYSLYTGALRSIASGISTLINTTASIYEGTLFIDNLITFIDEKTEIVPSLPKPRHPQRHIAHKIELKNVSFRYPGTSRDVIKNMSVTFEPGETVVLVGLNGAGKTTLIKLITRLYDPTEGVILLDGHDIREYDISELYSIYGIIFQDFGRYAVSVRENVSFSDINSPIDDERVSKAAKESGAEDFIKNLPGGYDTALMRYFEEDGIELSTGQWQKLSVARAFYSDSDILILDEPTAALDAIAEQEIYSQFDSLRKDKTTIFVSHRLSSATTADKILVLEDGQIIESGTHRELMRKGGRYCELFSTQAQRYIASESDIKK